MKKIIPRKLKKILKEPMRPPETKRFCEYCQKPRTFKYNPFVFHSECTSCGSNSSKKLRDPK